jgi:hypothetical protein
VTQHERIACILWFTYKQGWRDHLFKRLGKETSPHVPTPSDEEVEEWDKCDPAEKAKFMRSAEDFLSNEDSSDHHQEVTGADLAAEALFKLQNRRRPL